MARTLTALIIAIAAVMPALGQDSRSKDAFSSPYLEALTAIKRQRKDLSLETLRRDRDVVTSSATSLTGFYRANGFDLEDSDVDGTNAQLWADLRTKYEFVSPGRPLTRDLYLRYVRQEGIFTLTADILQKQLPESARGVIAADKGVLISSRPKLQRELDKFAWDAGEDDSSANLAIVWRDYRTRHQGAQLTPLTDDTLIKYMGTDGAFGLAADRVRKARPEISDQVLAADKAVMDDFLADLRNPDGKVKYDPSEITPQDLYTIAALAYIGARTRSGAVPSTLRLPRNEPSDFASTHATLIVEASTDDGPVKASVLIDGQEVGKTRYAHSEDPGQYEVRVKAGSDYEPWTSGPITLLPGTTKKYAPKLKKKA